MSALLSNNPLPTFFSNCLEVEYKNSYGTTVKAWFHWEDVNKIKQWMWVYDLDLKDIKKVVTGSLEAVSSEHKWTDRKSFMWFIETELELYSRDSLNS